MLLLLVRSTSAAAVLGLRTGLPLSGGLAAPISPFLLVPGAPSAAWAAEALASASSAVSTRRTCNHRLLVCQDICHRTQRCQSGVRWPSSMHSSSSTLRPLLHGLHLLAAESQGEVD